MPERDRLHRRLLEEARAEYPAARAERRAIVLAGPPGAGKPTVLTHVEPEAVREREAAECVRPSTARSARRPTRDRPCHSLFVSLTDSSAAVSSR